MLVPGLPCLYDQSLLVLGMFSVAIPWAGAGPVIAGWLYDQFGSYQVAFWLCVGAFVLAAVSVARTPRAAPPP